MTARARPPPSAPVTRPDDSALTAAAHQTTRKRQMSKHKQHAPAGRTEQLRAAQCAEESRTCASEKDKEERADKLSRHMLLELLLLQGLRELPAPNRARAQVSTTRAQRSRAHPPCPFPTLEPRSPPPGTQAPTAPCQQPRERKQSRPSARPTGSAAPARQLLALPAITRSSVRGRCRGTAAAIGAPRSAANSRPASHTESLRCSQSHSHPTAPSRPPIWCCAIRARRHQSLTAAARLHLTPTCPTCDTEQRDRMGNTSVKPHGRAGERGLGHKEEHGPHIVS